GCRTPTADKRVSPTSTPPGRATRRTHSHPTSRAAGTAIPTTPTRAGGSSTTAVAVTVGSVRTMCTPLATTASRTPRFSVKPLPAVAFVDPGFLGEATGTGADDHPFNDVRAGEAFLNQIYAAVTHSPAWPNTVLIFNFDEWGGFFDHVPPRAAPIPDADRAAG